ncbi:GntR family transcriptional regulator [Bauldia sp.]|uniref:GntR family transcriptional regulator n=1 Tax=Bauldia sp. TaxID=2575872 RepID=UPI0025C0A34E|nr:GntR family transcriptional regulator [Bauldia sp.]
MPKSAEPGLGPGMIEAYGQIRRAILQGDFAPGSRLSQVKIATALGLSRTPVREALRMIEKEGLVTSSHGRQVVITPTSMADLDELYALRIKLDTTTVRTTVPLLTDADLEEMQACLDTMVANEAPDCFDAFDEAHRQFHLIALRAAGPRHLEYSARLNEHAERYRRLYLFQASSYQQSKDEHAAIMEGCLDRDGDRVAHLLAEHYARIALTIVAGIEPAFEPWLVRSAVGTVTGSRTGQGRKGGTQQR